MKCKCCQQTGKVMRIMGMFCQYIETCPVCKGKCEVSWLRAFLFGWL